MASPFDFSSFLLTPPIPNYSNNYSTGSLNNANNARQSSNNDATNTEVSANTYQSSLPASGPLSSMYGAPNSYSAQQSDQNMIQQPQSSSSYTRPQGEVYHQTSQQSQQPTMQYLDNQGVTGAQSSYGSFNPSSFGGYSDSGNNNLQSYHSSLPSASGNAGQSGNELPPIASGSNCNRLSMSAPKMPSLDERDYGLDPSAFSNVSFQMPSFLQASSQPGEYGDGPAVVDPSAFRTGPPQGMSIFQPSFLSPPAAPPQQVAQVNAIAPSTFNKATNSTPNAPVPATEKKQYVPDPKNPVYGVYGSSVISVNPDPSPFKLALSNAIQPKLTAPPESRSGSPDFDPKSLGLPVGDQLFPQPLPGLYSSSGFDMLGVLARVVARPNPQINIGPVDTSCSFLVVDARRYDMPIVFASDTFSKLTGYANVRGFPSERLITRANLLLRHRLRSSGETVASCKLPMAVSPWGADESIPILMRSII